jgi:hypothetical protein
MVRSNRHLVAAVLCCWPFATVQRRTDARLKGLRLSLCA